MPRKPTTKKITTKAVQAAEGQPPPVDPAKVVLPVKPEGEGDAPWGADGLTHKQRLFVKAYVGPAAGNATEAARMAGYSDSNRNVLGVTGWDTLRKSNVQRAIARETAAREGGPEWTRQGIVEIARSSAADFITFDANGRPVPDLKAMAEAGALGTLKKVKFDGETGAVTEIVPHDRLHALGLLAKIHGIAPDQTNVTFTTPQQHAIGQLLRDPQALAMARQLAERMNGSGVRQGDDHKNGNGSANGSSDGPAGN